MKTCKECGGDLELGVARNLLGWYLSYYCRICGKIQYFGTHEEALEVILSWLPEGERQEFIERTGRGLTKVIEEMDKLNEEVKTVALLGELAGLDGAICTCGNELLLDVQSSVTGWYLGYFCGKCGPYSRETGYFATHAEAQEALDAWLMDCVKPANVRHV